MCTVPMSLTTTTNPVGALPKGQEGLSLVELMVAVVIGLLTVLAITQAMSFFENQRRGTTTGADAQSNGALATYMVERELRLAGYGVYVNDEPDPKQVHDEPDPKQVHFINACARGSVRFYNSQRDPADIQFQPDNVPFVPVVINPPGIPAGDANSDVIGLAYGSSNMGLTGKGTDIMSGNASEFLVENPSAFATGDLMMLVPPLPPYPTAGSACSVYEVTSGPPRACTESVKIEPLGYGTAGYKNAYQNCAVTVPTHNKPGGLGVPAANYVLPESQSVKKNRPDGTSYYPRGQAFNIGNRDGLTFAYYAVRNGLLTRCNHTQNNCADAAKTGDADVWTPIAAEIVTLRAEFGLADAPAGAINTWRTTVCAAAGCVPTADDWLRLRAIRIATVARSQQPANVESVAPSWNGQEEIVLNDPPNRFRYHTTEVVIPLRNLVWGGSE